MIKITKKIEAACAIRLIGSADTKTRSSSGQRSGAADVTEYWLNYRRSLGTRREKQESPQR